MNPNFNEDCSLCNNKMEFIRYDGDWAILECESDECSSKILRPVSNPSKEGFTMESLGHVSDYVSDDK